MPPGPFLGGWSFIHLATSWVDGHLSARPQVPSGNVLLLQAGSEMPAQYLGIFIFLALDWDVEHCIGLYFWSIL